MLCLDEKKKKRGKKIREKKIRRIENKRKNFFTIDIQLSRKREERK